MRRPVKPFVTEYKAPIRRSRDLFGPAPATAGTREPSRPAPEGWSHADEPQSEAYRAAMKAADALFSPAAAPDAATGEVASGAGPAGRRILRAIEDAPDVTDEPEQAPRRRGRKLGSKNRPKPNPVTESARPDASPFSARASQATGEADDEPAITSAEAAAARVTRPSRTRHNRFPWLSRRTLRPGEEWKRRLPKVCW